MLPDQFVKQFQQLLLVSPRYNLKQVQVENCDYADTAVKSKNVYYSFGAFYCEDVLYARYSRKCTDCCDIAFCVGCQLCIGCSDCADCYNVSNSRNSIACVDCDYCEDCHSCSNCFGCVGLRRAKYCVFNRQLTAAAYREFIESSRLQLSEDSIYLSLKELRSATLIPALHMFRTEDSIGSNLSECTGSYHCYDSFALEDCFYCIETNGNKDCCDLTVCFEAELCYSCVHSPFNYNCNFLLHTDRSTDCEFCAYSRNLKSCFGCVGLSDKQFYILNRPVAPQVYPEMVASLRRGLQESGALSLGLYFASAYERARERGESERPIQVIEEETFMKDLLICINSNCRKQFRVIAKELAYYQKKGLPLPRSCPECRHRERMALRSERRLYRRECEKCRKSIPTTYPPDAPYLICCQDCFWADT